MEEKSFDEIAAQKEFVEFLHENTLSPKRWREHILAPQWLEASTPLYQFYADDAPAYEVPAVPRHLFLFKLLWEQFQLFKDGEVTQKDLLGTLTGVGQLTNLEAVEILEALREKYGIC